MWVGAGRRLCSLRPEVEATVFGRINATNRLRVDPLGARDETESRPTPRTPRFCFYSRARTSVSAASCFACSNAPCRTLFSACATRRSLGTFHWNQATHTEDGGGGGQKEMLEACTTAELAH